MAENKVRFGLKNVHYAIYDGSAWGTPVSIPGAVSLDLSAEGDLTKFYGDNIVYYSTYADNGYSGSLEIARIPDQMYQDVWGYTQDGTSKVITENSSVEPAVFALLYQIDGDANNECFVLYSCTASRPNIGSSTIEDTKEPQTQSMDITAVPMTDGKVMARTTADTPAATKTGWFASVYTA